MHLKVFQQINDYGKSKRIFLLPHLTFSDHLAVIWLNHDQAQSCFPSAWALIWNKAFFRICTDGAANHLKPLCEAGKVLVPSVISGDFDSIHDSTKEYFTGKCELKHTPDQENTDLCKALKMIEESEGFKNGTVRTLHNNI